MQHYESVETGVMVMKDGKAWGIAYEDGKSTCHGWIDPQNAPLSDPRYLKSPTDVTYKGSPDEAELRTAKIVHVERRTQLIVKD